MFAWCCDSTVDPFQNCNCDPSLIALEHVVDCDGSAAYGMLSFPFPESGGVGVERAAKHPTCCKST